MDYFLTVGFIHSFPAAGASQSQGAFVLCVWLQDGSGSVQTPAAGGAGGAGIPGDQRST